MVVKKINYISRLRKNLEKITYFLIFLSGLILFFLFLANKNYQNNLNLNNYKEHLQNQEIFLIQKNHKLPGRFTEKSLKFPTHFPSPPKIINIPILMYHSVGGISVSPTDLEYSLTISPDIFEQQLNYLKEKKYQTITMEELFKALYYNKKLPSKSIILTFDDGYDNHYYNVYHLLKKYNFKGSFYIITSLIGQPGRLNQQQIKEMANNGMEFGSHSINHPDFSQLNEQEIDNELYRSKLSIEKIINKEIYSFCYPAGKYDSRSFDLLKKEGYLLALTVNSGTTVSSDHPFEIPRLRIDGKNPLEDFKKLLP